MKSGTVTLVGAGPGDPELLTVKALKAIQAADVLLVDDLVSAEIVALARAGARIVHVGKRGGCRSTPQRFIHQLMVRAAREGANVVRLKGGDPLIFGRGGEEMEYARAAGVAVTVHNGITAGIAAATALDMALTHRDHAQGVVFVTAHARRGATPVDWRALAAAASSARLTLVIYMGLKSAQWVQDQLLASLPDSTPAAVVQDASLPGQRVLRTALGQLAQAIVRGGFSSPAIIVVGEVARTAALAADVAAAAPQTAPPAPIARRR